VLSRRVQNGHWPLRETTVILFRMARPQRGEFSGAVHHVIPKGNGGRRIVEDEEDRFAYTARLNRITRELGWLVHSSCLMDTHHHAVLETPEPNLSVGMKRLLGGHSRWLNVRHRTSGSVFKPHYWSRVVDDDAWLFRACLYVVLNPVAAGLCAHPREWRWSSYRTTAEGDPGAFAPGEERLLRMFGSTPSESRRCYSEVIDAAAANIAGRRLDERGLWHALRAVESPVGAAVPVKRFDIADRAPPVVWP
jgi:REP element-mobilizing transposase RayT